MVLGVCRTVLGNPQDAEDAFQAVFLVLAHQASAIRKRESVGSFLHGVAYRLAQKAKVRAAKHLAALKTTPAPPAVPGPMEDLRVREWQAILHEELARLPQKYRVVLWLCYWEGKTRDEAARQLGLRFGTLRERLERARNLLHSRLLHRGLTPSAALFTALFAQHQAEALPPALTASTVKAAVFFAGFAGTTGPASAAALTLARGAIRTMNVKTRMVVALALLLISGAASGLGILASQPDPKHAKQEAPNKDAAMPEEPKNGEPRPDLVNKPGTDAFGDPLPAGALARLGTVRFRHGNGVFLIAFSADGKKIVFGGSGAVDNAIRMVEASTGKELRTFAVKPQEKPSGLDLSQDGNILILSSFNFKKPEGAFVAWDTASGKELARIDCGKQPPDVVVFSPNGRVFVTQERQRIGNTNNFQTRMCVWDAPTSKLLHEFKDLEGKVSRPAFSPDGRRLAISISAHDQPREPTKGIFYDTATWRTVQPMAERPLLVVRNASRHYDREYLAYSPDGKLLMGGDWFNHVDFMKAETGELIERVPLQLVGASEATPVRSITFSRDGKMAVLSLSGVVTIWELRPTRKVLYNLPGYHSAAVFSPTEPLLVTGAQQNEGRGTIPGGGYPALRFWDPSTGKQIVKDDAPAAPVHLTHWLPDGKLLAVSPGENCYRLWDWRTSKQLAKVPLGEKFQWVAWSAASPDGKLLAVSQFNGNGNDETIQLFDLATGKVSQRLESKMVRLPMGFTAKGRFLLAGVDPNVIAIWDTTDGKLSRSLDLKNDLQKGFARLAAVSGDGKKLALQVSELLVEPSGPDPGGVMWPTGFYRCVIDVATGKRLWGTKRDDSAHPECVSAFLFSPDGKILAERIGQTIQLRDSTTGAILRVLKCDNERWEALAFTPDSKKLIGADLRNNVYVWDVATGKELQKFTGHRGRIFSISVSLDRTMFATASEDSTILIWRLDGR
jgi:RNA polymerase sigma factor (sigma-70 family)